MEDLIKALNVFLKYGNENYPTHCEHDVLYITEIKKEQVNEEDIAELDRLGFFWSGSDECFVSYKFGSA